ncbi:splicing factor 3A subunit 2 [Trypanosoma rangeli]|uniref:Splicing factor 3A subunit 2 n=1 Tax=Trypanosoma rangeli TaxID=5698 RepID=A0A422MZP8_TRYRA|nr:splicing factor 3A subunit 2 [Trypanosoma rangeli]RNE98715.1 splicing factor 3A subunit 2 [Trypanosoma rangeli]|eukprot:RNE98715.1 splicing factor 3A subunit 2 [Trypanosoma rangeli]
MSSVKALNPSVQARRDPYYKRNHMGRVTCTLCDVCCTDDNNFLKHIAGKTHRTQLERMERYARREERLAVEEELSREASRRAEQEKATRELLQQQQDPQGGSRSGAPGTAAFAPFGRPQFNYCTENDPELFQTKVWLEFFFPQAAAGVRPCTAGVRRGSRTWNDRRMTASCIYSWRVRGM